MNPKYTFGAVGSIPRKDEAETLYPFRYAVQGRGPFPFDMLRRDEAYPASEGDASHMSAAFDDRARTVNLASWHDRRTWFPLELRWQSFGWDIVFFQGEYL